MTKTITDNELRINGFSVLVQTFGDGVVALPERMNGEVLFYRCDSLREASQNG